LRIEGLDNAEIAARFALPQDLVRQRLSRAVKLLQERW
jgi:DNA-directed RNA polymerase specialized sigma24 family protein